MPIASEYCKCCGRVFYYEVGPGNHRYCHSCLSHILGSIEDAEFKVDRLRKEVERKERDLDDMELELHEGKAASEYLRERDHYKKLLVQVYRLFKRQGFQAKDCEALDEAARLTRIEDEFKEQACKKTT